MPDTAQCARPGCDRVFSRSKSTQQYCSHECCRLIRRANARTALMPAPVPGAIWIALTRGRFALVDSEMAGDLMRFTWTFGGRYAYRAGRPGKTKTVFLHRHVLGLTTPQTRRIEVDHRNLDKLDCRRQNLRVADSSRNKANTEKPKTNSSGVKGVSWDCSRGKWRAVLAGRTLGRFDDRALAVAAYNRAAVQRWGEFARTSSCGGG